MVKLSYASFDKESPSRTFYMRQSDFRTLRQRLVDFARCFPSSVPLPYQAAENLLKLQSQKSATGDVEIELTQKQHDLLLKYIASRNYFVDSFGQEDLQKADAILAFSYGEVNEVNAEIARQISELPRLPTPIPIYAQWEIADLLWRRYGMDVERIEIEPKVNEKNLRDELGLVQRNINLGNPITGIPSPYSTPAVINALNHALITPDFYDRIPDAYPASDLLPSNPAIERFARTTLSYRRGLFDHSPSVCFDDLTNEQQRNIQQLNLAILMTLFPRETLEFYLFSWQVRDKFVQRWTEVRGNSPQKVFLAAQAWHGVRCIKLCAEKGPNVVGGTFVDKFSPGDPQLWVRDPFSWLVKETFAWAKEMGLIKEG